jgi:hypothetical protein
MSAKTLVAAQDEYRLQTAVILLSLYFEKCSAKAKEASLLAQAKTHCKKNQWPYPVIQYLNGELAESAIVAPSSDANLEKLVYVGLRKMIQGKPVEAAADFRAAQKLPITENGPAKTVFRSVAAAMLSILS